MTFEDYNLTEKGQLIIRRDYFSRMLHNTKLS